MDPEQVKWLLALGIIVVMAIALSVPPSSTVDKASQKAFDEVNDWIVEQFGRSWWFVLAINILILLFALNSTSSECQYTLVALMVTSGLVLTLIGSRDLSSQEYKAYTAMNIGIGLFAVSQIIK